MFLSPRKQENKYIRICSFSLKKAARRRLEASASIVTCLVFDRLGFDFELNERRNRKRQCGARHADAAEQAKQSAAEVGKQSDEVFGCGHDVLQLVAEIVGASNRAAKAGLHP